MRQVWPQHPRQTRAITLLSIACACLILTACTSDPYESGDTEMSYLTVEWGMGHSAQSAKIDVVTADRGETLRPAQPYYAPWAQTPDSLYRVIAYTDRRETVPRFFLLREIPVIHPITKTEALTDGDDMMTIETCRLSRSYIDLSILVKTGTKESPPRQKIALVLDSIGEDDRDHSRIIYLKLRHYQNDDKAYYTTRSYLSIPRADFQPGDSVCLSSFGMRL